MIPQSFIDELLSKADITEVIGRYVQLKPAGTSLVGLCPFHNEKTPSFSVSPAKQVFHCFGCGASGNAIGFVMDHLGLSFPEAIEHVANGMGIAVPHVQAEPVDAEEKTQRSMQLDALAKAAQWYAQQLPKHQNAIQYLKSRGVSGQVAARFGLGYAPDDYQGLASVFADYEHNALLDEVGLTKTPSDKPRRYDRFRGRVMFPIRDVKGQVIGFGGRVLDGAEPKYLNSPETPLFNKGQEVYGLFEGRSAIHKMGYALVTEGYMDVVALAQWGFENAVATLGTAVTGVHVQRLFKTTDRLVFAFDGDKAGQKAAWRALQAALLHVNERKRADFIFFPPEHDPDSFIRTEGAEAFESMVAQAVPLSAFLLQYLNAHFELQHIEGRAQATVFLGGFMPNMPNSLVRQALVRSLAELLHSTPHELMHAWGMAGRALSSKPSAYGATGNHRAANNAYQAAQAPKGYQVHRPGGKSLWLSMAARLIRCPDAWPNCETLLQLYQKSTNPPSEMHSFALLVQVVASKPERLEAKLYNVFNDDRHQPWMNAVLKEVQHLDDNLDMKNVDIQAELDGLIAQCTEAWYKAELERLSQLMPLPPEQVAWYQDCMQQFQTLKLSRGNPL